TKPEKAQTSKSKRQENRVGQFFEIKDMVVNPAGTLGRRFLVIELGLETHNSKLVEEAQTKEIWMRDAIISLLTQKTTDELLDITKRDVLKKEILDLLNSKMSKTKFEKLYFTKYIMQ
ncbi:MAG: flagellar basal body-associated protein FliL, partial [bacterium]